MINKKPCRTGKFGSKCTAQAYARYIQNNLGKELIVYECPVCFHWHAGRENEKWLIGLKSFSLNEA
jgi:predicted GTPase